jgi:hypothetical protein
VKVSVESTRRLLNSVPSTSSKRNPNFSIYKCYHSDIKLLLIFMCKGHKFFDFLQRYFIIMNAGSLEAQNAEGGSLMLDKTCDILYRGLHHNY